MTNLEIEQHIKKIYRQLRCTQSCISGLHPSGDCNPLLFINQCGDAVEVDNIYNSNGNLTSNRTLEAGTFSLQLQQTDAAIGQTKFIIINTAPLLRIGSMATNLTDVGFYAGNTNSSAANALRTQIEVVDGNGVSTGWYAQYINQVYTTGLRMDNTNGGTTMVFENHNGSSFFTYDCDTVTTTLGTTGDPTDLVGDVTLSALAGNGSGVVAVDNNGLLSWSSVGGLGAWLNIGNTGLTDTVNNLFGTTDDIPVRFIVNGQQAGFINGTASNSVAFGLDSLIAADNVTSIGSNAGNGGSGPKDNSTFVGAFAGLNTQSASDCVYIGYQAGFGVIGINNTVIGSGAMSSNSFDNAISIGHGSVITADNQFAVGSQTNLNFPSIVNIKTAALVAFDDDADAGGGGLTTGDWYQTTGGGAAPLNIAGIVMIKQ